MKIIFSLDNYSIIILLATSASSDNCFVEDTILAIQYPA